MPWFSENPEFTQPSLPDYGSATTISVTDTSQQVVAAGSSPRFISVSVADNASKIYVNYGAAVDVGTKAYVYVLPAKFQNNKIEIPGQAVHMACNTGETASVIIAVAE